MPGVQRPTLLGVAAVAVASCAWLSILRCYFAADDFLHLYHLVNLGPRDLVLATFGGHMLAVRNLVMVATFALFGLHPLPYFVTVLATHMANTALVLSIAERMGATAGVAFLAAVLFAVTPTHAAALGWYSVYGYVLSCFFTLLALWLLVPAGADREEITTGRAVLVALVMLAASQSFGAGAGTALVAPLVAAVLRPGAFRKPVVAAVLCAIPVGVVLAARFLFFRESALNAHPENDVGLLLSFFWDLPDVIPMTAHLAGLGAVTLVLQSAYSPAAYPNVTSAIVLGGLAVGLVAAVARGDGVRRRTLVALVLVLGATAGAIALGRATIAHLVRADGVVGGVRATPRYFYQIQAICAVLVAVVLEASTRGRVGGVVRAVLVGGGTIAALGGWILHPPSIDHYDRQRDLVALVRRTIADEVETHPPGAPVCLSIDGRQEGLLAATRSVFPGWAAIFMLLHPTDEVAGRRVYFTTEDEVVLDARKSGGRIASLLVPTGSCPP